MPEIEPPEIVGVLIVGVLIVGVLIVGLVKVLFVSVLVFVLSAITNAVVANCVVLVSADAVGAAGVPVKVGDAISALELIAPEIELNSLSISVPLTILFESPVGSVSLVAKLVALV
jgi:hypothetical protein